MTDGSPTDAPEAADSQPERLLLPTAAERETLLRAATERLNRHWNNLPDRPLGPELSREDIARRIAAVDFDQPMPLDDVIGLACDLLECGIVHVAHPRYFGLFNPTPNFAGVLGDLLASAYNPQLAVRSHAPAAVEAEAHVIRSLGARLGFPPDSVSGHFTSGGSEANMTAALAALTKAFPSYAEEGLASLPRRPRLYVSRESHFAWFKIAHQLGLGRTAVRLVDTDGQGRMDAAMLERAVAEDVTAGHAPFFVAATAGTTNAGMIDPLQACADIAVAHHLWFHVDAAWAGALIVSDRLKAPLAGIERADSVTIDAHKWFSVPMGAGMYIGRDQGALQASFRVAASYMPSRDAAEDPYLLTTQWSRRFIGLKLFMALAAAGWDGYAEVIAHQLDMAALLRRELQGAGFAIVNDSPVAVVCFVPTDGRPPADVVERVQEGQRCWLSLAQFEGRPVIRAGITSFRTTSDEVHSLVGELVTQG